jgi:hypothetical protein
MNLMNVLFHLIRGIPMRNSLICFFITGQSTRVDNVLHLCPDGRIDYALVDAEFVLAHDKIHKNCVATLHGLGERFVGSVVDCIDRDILHIGHLDRHAGSCIPSKSTDMDRFAQIATFVELLDMLNDLSSLVACSK